MISFHFQRCSLSYQIINPNHRNSNQLTTQYNNQIHNRIWTIITKLQNQIQKLRNISCRRNCLNFTHFLSIQLPRAENQSIKYIHKHTSKTVLNIVIRCQIQIGSHFILECTTPKIQAHKTNAISKFLIFILELASKYKNGNNHAHNKADIKIRRFCPEDSIQK